MAAVLDLREPFRIYGAFPQRTGEGSATVLSNFFY